MAEIAASVASTFLTPVVNKASEILLKDFELSSGVKDEIQELQRKAVLINAILEIAEEKQFDNRVITAWIEGIKDIAYDAENLLDEFFTEASLRGLKRDSVRRKKWTHGDNGVEDVSSDTDQNWLKRYVVDGKRQLRQVSSRVLEYYFASLRTILFHHDIAHQIVDIRKKFDVIFDEHFKLDLKVPHRNPSPNQLIKTRETSSHPEEDLCARMEEKERLIEMSLRRSRVGVSLISIVGMGGMGKTTLARSVFNDTRIKQHFDFQKWLYVWETLDVKTLIVEITAELLEEDNKKTAPNLKHPANDSDNTKNDLTSEQKFASKSRKYTEDPSSEQSSIEFRRATTASSSLQHLHDTLIDKLKNRKFFIILDDAWSQKRSEWESLSTALFSGVKSGIVIVTTRSNNVSNAITNDPSKIKQITLQECDCWPIFEKHAFTDGEEKDKMGLESIGKKICEKCKGIPLAAKFLGCFLNNKPKEIWDHTLEQNNLWSSLENDNNLIPILKWSYQHLPKHLKQCFSFCSIFPKNHQFDKRKLVHLWMAHDLIQPQRYKEIEEIGSDYFDELHNMLFFEYRDDTYVMHDFMHDLAELVAKDECITVRHDDSIATQRIVYAKVLHLSFNNNIQDLGMLSGFKKLRTLISISPSDQRQRIAFDLNDVFNQLRYLRVLDLSGLDIVKLPKSIEKLKHLRFLALTSTCIQILPKEICNLYNLQTLKVNKYCSFPIGMSRLVNLSHLEGGDDCISNIVGLGNLTLLQEIKSFIVHKNNSSSIKELKSLRRLRQLKMYKLRNATKENEVEQLKIKEMIHLEELLLSWKKWHYKSGKIINIGTLEKVIEHFHPPHSLKHLTIEGYEGTKLPNWMVTGGFPSLKTLHMENLPNLEEWTDRENGNQHFPSLHALRIKDCPDLKNLPELPLSLLELELVSTEINSSPRYYGYNTRSTTMKTKDSSHPHLRSLKVKDCPKLTTLRPLLQQYKMKHLEEMTIYNCESLAFLVDAAERMTNAMEMQFPALQKLIISRCPELEIFPELPCSLLELDVGGIGTKCLPQFCNNEVDRNQLDLPFFGPNVIFETLTMLTKLSIRSCPSITSLPSNTLRHLRSLKTLRIYECENLRCLGFQGLAASLKEFIVSGCPSLDFSNNAAGPLMEASHHSSLSLCSSSSDQVQHTASLETSNIQLSQREESPSEAPYQSSSSWEASSLETVGTDNLSLLSFIRQSPISSLQVLSFSDSKENVLFHEEEQNGLGSLTSLQQLEIIRCEKIMSLPKSLTSLTKLEKLVIFLCPDFWSSDQEEEFDLQSLTSLRRLKLNGCASLRWLPESMHRLPKLESLWISYCKKIKRLPEQGLPLSLTELHIRGCPELRRSCTGRRAPERRKIPPSCKIFIDGDLE